MEMSRGLLAVLALLGMGMCWDVAIVLEGSSALWIGLLLLIGRVAAIAGILLRTRVGWLLAVGFFVVIIALNLMAAPLEGAAAVVRVFLPVLCLGYLLIMRSEFD
jgi:hypothetical protein